MPPSNNLSNLSNPGDPSLDTLRLASTTINHSTDAPGSVALNELSELLWFELMKSFDATTAMDAEERFPSIAKSLRTVLLDHPSFNTAAEFVLKQERFTGDLSHSLQTAWCSQRDAYLVHGDARPLLGRASRAVYTFIRDTLKVPLLSTSKLRTPKVSEGENGIGIDGIEAPTVGSYTGVVSRALRDGTLAKVAVDILAASQEEL